MRNINRLTTILVGFIIGALAYWFQPYNETEVFGISVWLLIALAAFFVSLVIIMFFNEKPFKIALHLSLGVILAVLARIIYDVIFFDSSSHNFAPFEILFAGVVALPSAMIAVYLGNFIKRQLN